MSITNSHAESATAEAGSIALVIDRVNEQRVVPGGQRRDRELPVVTSQISVSSSIAGSSAKGVVGKVIPLSIIDVTDSQANGVKPRSTGISCSTLE